jgi:hypothetical protein
VAHRFQLCEQCSIQVLVVHIHHQALQ